MSSVTSTEPQPLQPWQFFTLAGLIGATIVVFLSNGQTPAGIILLSCVIFGAAAVGVAAWRMFSPLVGEDGPAGPQVFGGRTRAALEREKTLVLRSIKDLEFDHAMGKLSEKDFTDMGARLRGRAAGLLRQLDAGGGYRDAIQLEIDKRLGPRKPAAPISVGRALSGAPTDGEPDKVRPTEVRPTEVRPTETRPAEAEKPATKVCLSCCTVNDVDARFCKGCGYQLGNW
jgi:ribosomal protein L40E